ncbi:MAG: outer membrane protein assembly factor BamE [Gammaproteobacteria bacterium]
MKLFAQLKLLLTATVLLQLTSCSSGGGPTLPKVPLPDLSLPDVTQSKLPFVHRLDVQQGNVVTQEMIAQLKYGMDKKKVRYIMGTPVIKDTFHANRWDYLFTEQKGGDDMEKRQVTLYFENELLAKVDGDVTPAAGRLVVDTRQDTQVEVPGEFKKGFLQKVKDSMPIIGKDDDKQENADDTEKGQNADIAQDGDIAESNTSEPELAETEGSGDTAADDVELADENAVIVPEDAPKKKKKKGFFKRIFDSVGLGAEEDEEDEVEYDTADPRYRTGSPQDEL